MGWGRTLLLGDIGTQMNVDDCARDLEAIQNQIRAERGENLSQNELIQRLRGENEELKLYLAAVARILIAKGVVTRDELMKVVDAVDREDGCADGRFDGPVV